ncbi:Uncharacterised protein [Vibrio cholerae]|nr:Uncharacterised protein [Vibrio cholerae]
MPIQLRIDSHFDTDQMAKPAHIGGAHLGF